MKENKNSHFQRTSNLERRQEFVFEDTQRQPPSKIQNARSPTVPYAQEPIPRVQPFHLYTNSTASRKTRAHRIMRQFHSFDKLEKGLTWRKDSSAAIARSRLDAQLKGCLHFSTSCLVSTSFQLLLLSTPRYPSLRPMMHHRIHAHISRETIAQNKLPSHRILTFVKRLEERPLTSAMPSSTASTASCSCVRFP